MLIQSQAADEAGIEFIYRTSGLSCHMTLFPGRIGNLLNCGIYSSRMDSPLHSKGKVGSIDQKMLMKQMRTYK